MCLSPFLSSEKILWVSPKVHPFMNSNASIVLRLKKEKGVNCDEQCFISIFNLSNFTHLEALEKNFFLRYEKKII